MTFEYKILATTGNSFLFRSGIYQMWSSKNNNGLQNSVYNSWVDKHKKLYFYHFSSLLLNFMNHWITRHNYHMKMIFQYLWALPSNLTDRIFFHNKNIYTKCEVARITMDYKILSITAE